MGMRVTVFGGSKPVLGEPAYDEAFYLGQLLGSKGFAVLTGGYIGTMEAVSRGAAEAGGHVVGVTCDEIEAWRPVAPNQWVMEEMRFTTLRQRLYGLIDECDAAIALPGGIGTLAEVAAFWSQSQVSAGQVRPLVLIGDGWQATLETFIATQDEYIAEIDRGLLTFAPDVAEAFIILESLTPNP
jgi:uncharacterized protein (TIGR00730 family)